MKANSSFSIILIIIAVAFLLVYGVPTFLGLGDIKDATKNTLGVGEICPDGTKVSELVDTIKTYNENLADEELSELFQACEKLKPCNSDAYKSYRSTCTIISQRIDS